MTDRPPTWKLDPEQFHHSILDLVGAQPPQLRRELLEALVRHPGESIAVRHLRPNVAEVTIRDLDNTWHPVGTIDIGQLETAGLPDWN